MTFRPLHHTAFVVLGLCAMTNVVTAQAPQAHPDPVTNDPPQVDSASPAGMGEIEIPSMGSRMNGLFYLASGRGPHPTVILLHGFPGNERNLDLAQAIRRAGINVVFFSYRGAWGSGGTFSFAHALEDVAAAVRFVRSDETAREYVDPTRVVLLGHSMGAWLALLGAAADSSIACTGALDGWNAGASGRAFGTIQGEDSVFTAYAEGVTASGGPIRAESGRALTSELEAHADAWDVDSSAPRLSTRPVLVISSTENPFHQSFTAALRSAGARKVTALAWHTDHTFSSMRIKLAHAVIDWLQHSCGL